MKLTVTISGDFDIGEEDIPHLVEDFDDEARWFWNASGLVIEVGRDG